MPWIFVLFALAMVGVIVSIAYQRTKATHQAWEVVARQLGLRYQPASWLGHPRIQGTLQGCHVTVDTYRTGGENSTTYTRFAIKYGQPLGLGLRIAHEGFFSGIAKWFGAQDIEVGDPSFDRAARVKGAHEPAVKEFLNPARRLRILRCLRVYPAIEIDDVGIRWSKRGVLRKAAELIATTQDFVRLAWHLTGERDEDERLQRALTLQNEGNPEEALTMLETTLQSHPMKSHDRPSAVSTATDGTALVEEAWMAGELYELGGQTERSQQAFQRAQAVSPQDDEIRAWADEAKRPRSPIPSAQLPQDELATPAAVVSAELFREGVSTFECKRIFGERFADRRIQWSGVLLKLEQNYSSFLFEVSGGIKATIKIDERQSPYFGPQDILSVVHISVENGERLGDRIGQVVSFSGRLLKVDGLMRNIFVDHGSIEPKQG